MNIRLLKSIVAPTLLLTLLLSNTLVFGAEIPRFASPPEWYKRQDPYPPSWAKTLPWTGELKIRFSPGWGDSNSPFFWSYVLFYWLNGDVLTNRTDLEKALHEYDAGLYGKKFSPERIKLEVEDKPPTTKLGHAVTMRWVTICGFDAEMTQRELTTHLKTFRWYCPESDHTALVILRTPQPFEVTNEVWTSLFTFWDTAACHDEQASEVLRR
jgi:hypothetical protein